MATTPTQEGQGTNFNVAGTGLHLNTSVSQVPKGKVTFAMNAVLEGFDGEKVSYQNELGNEICITFPEGYKVIGRHPIYEKDLVLFWLSGKDSSEIGKLDVKKCEYQKLINAACINLDINYPILKAFHRITNTSTEVYWTDGKNKMRWIDLENLPFREEIEGCDITTYSDIDCNKLNLQPNFSIPKLFVKQIDFDGEIEAGVYQAAVQYSNAAGEAYTSYYSVTNPVPIYDGNKITQDFNYLVNKSITFKVENLDRTGLFDYVNIAVIKTVNNISSVELLGTYEITDSELDVTYSGQKGLIKLDIQDIFEKFPVFETAKEIFTVQDVLGFADITLDKRVNYQKIWNKVNLKWVSHRIKADSYKDPLKAANYKGYFRDETYVFEGVFILKNGKQTDRFIIPSRVATNSDLEEVYNDDVFDQVNDECKAEDKPLPKWKVYNTASVIDFTDEFKLNQEDSCYEGSYQYGNFAYTESTETYPCDFNTWGELAGKPIRHHKFPDNVVSPIFDDKGYVYPLGIRIDIDELKLAISQSDLTQEEKDNIAGFKIVRANRANNKSIVAKGLLYNVGKYAREGNTYLYPNYPYNDLRKDPFIVSDSNSITLDRESIDQEDSCIGYLIQSVPDSNSFLTIVQYTDCNGASKTVNLVGSGSEQVCSKTTPVVIKGNAIINGSGICDENGQFNDTEFSIFKEQLDGFSSNDSKNRFTFHSPDTHFYQPALGNILKVEAAVYGNAEAHFQEVKKHARYKFMSLESYLSAVGLGIIVGFASGSYGVGSTNPFNGTAAFTAFQSTIAIIENLLPRNNFCYQYTSIGEYNKLVAVPNNGNKQRLLDIAGYLIPGFQSLGDVVQVNNFQRESSVYLKTSKILPFVSEIDDVPEDNSRFTLSDEGNCDNPSKIETRDISAYYASIKKSLSNQYGRVYSYESIDTGFLELFKGSFGKKDFFGGDCFINKFSLKRKFPFFIDNRVNFPDDADIDYRDFGNVGYPKYWFSTAISQGNGGFRGIGALFGVRETNFDCKKKKFFYQLGKTYLFAYGIPTFFCESEVNVDLRQAINDKAGDYYPRVSSGIPDEWLQESNVSIINDNSYVYNKTYSKQNKENLFTFIPEIYQDTDRFLTHSLIYSEKRNNLNSNESRNNWLIYKPNAIFRLPQNYGRLISIDGIENKQILARFENKSMLYNAMYTVPMNTGAQFYLGKEIFSDQIPPLDFAETDLGYAGTQHKFLLKTEFGHVMVDAKRGDVFVFGGSGFNSISTEEVNSFLTNHLDFKITDHFPDVNIDNHFNGIGLHGVFDNRFNRVMITKLDYEPIKSGITHKSGKFYHNGKEIQLTNKEYFANRCFTISYNFKTQSWISFHSYTPNFYVGMNNFFYSSKGSSLWSHMTNRSLFNNFYGEIEPYIIEYPFPAQYHDEIIQGIKDYSRVRKVDPSGSFVQVDDVWFSKAILHNSQQCSGILELHKKPKNNLKAQLEYPKYNTDSKTILYTKSDNFYNYNTFWSLLKDKNQPIFKYTNNSVLPEINQDNMNYSKLSYKKDPIRGKDLRIRHILDNTSDYQIISEFVVTQTQKSWR